MRGGLAEAVAGKERVRGQMQENPKERQCGTGDRGSCRLSEPQPFACEKMRSDAFTRQEKHDPGVSYVKGGSLLAQELPDFFDISGMASHSQVGRDEFSSEQSRGHNNT